MESDNVTGLPSKASRAANLGDLTSAATARTNLALGSAATQDADAFDVAGAATSGVGDHVAATDPHGDRAYTDAAVAASLAAIPSRQECLYAAAAALPTNTYANGSSGTGATLTANVNGALMVDGQLVAVGQRILVPSEAALSHNGIYVVTAVGDLTTPYMLTRSTDFDQASEMGVPVLVPINSEGLTPGATNDKRIFLSVTSSPFVVGTTSLTFSLVGAAYTAGSGLTLSGTVFTLSPDTDSTFAANSDLITASQKAVATAFATDRARLDAVESRSVALGILSIAEYARIGDETTDDGRWTRFLADLYPGGDYEGYAGKIDTADPFELTAGIEIAHTVALIADGVPAFHQNTWGQWAIMVMPGADGTVLPNYTATNIPGATLSLRRRVGTQFRGDSTAVSCAALVNFASGLRCGVVDARSFFVGVRMEAWTGPGTSTDRDPALYRIDNRIAGVKFDGVDFGVLTGGQRAPKIGSISGRYIWTLPGIIGAPHALYQGPSIDPEYGPVTTWDGPPSFGQVLTISADGATGTFRLQSPWTPGQYTAAIDPATATAALVQARINALADVAADPTRVVVCNGGFSSAVAAGYDGIVKLSWGISIIFANLAAGQAQRPGLFAPDNTSLTGATVSVAQAGGPGCPIQLKGNQGTGYVASLMARNVGGLINLDGTSEGVSFGAVKGKGLRAGSVALIVDGQRHNLPDCEFDQVEPYNSLRIAGSGHTVKARFKTSWRAAAPFVDVEAATGKSYVCIINDGPFDIDIDHENDDPAGGVQVFNYIDSNAAGVVVRGFPGPFDAAGAPVNTGSYAQKGVIVRLRRSKGLAGVVRHDGANRGEDVVTYDPATITPVSGYAEAGITSPTGALVIRKPSTSAAITSRRALATYLVGAAATSTGALTAASQGRGGRVVADKAGLLKALTIYIGVSSGNIDVGVFGGMEGGARSRLWSSGSITSPGAGARVIGDPNVVVREGQILEVWIAADNTTFKFALLPTIAVSLPTTGSDVGLIAPVAASVFPLPSSIASAAEGSSLPFAMATIL